MATALIGVLVVAAGGAYALVLRSLFPNRFHFLDFHPIVDGLVAAGIVLILLGLYLRSRGSSQVATSQAKPVPQEF